MTLLDPTLWKGSNIPNFVVIIVTLLFLFQGLDERGSFSLRRELY